MSPMLAVTMIGENLDHAAFAHATVPAFIDHPTKFFAKGLQLPDAPFDLADVVARDRVDLGA